MLCICVRLYPFDLSFHDTGNANLRTDLDMTGCDLAIIAAFAYISALLDYAISASAAGRIISEYFNRLLARVESALARLYLWRIVFFTDLILKASAFEVFVKSLVGRNNFIFHNIPLYHPSERQIVIRADLFKFRLRSIPEILRCGRVVAPR